MSSQPFRRFLVIAVVVFLLLGGVSAGHAAPDSPAAPAFPNTLPHPSIHAIPGSDGASIDVYAGRLADLTGAASAQLTSYERGHTSYEPGHTDYTPDTGVYHFTFDGVTTPYVTGPSMSVQITTTNAAGAPITLGASEFIRHYVPSDLTRTFTSRDGAARLQIPAGALGSSHYLIIMDTATAPADPPAGYRRISRPFSVRASGTNVSPDPLFLELDFRAALLGDADRHTVSMFFWNEEAHRWEDVESEPWASSDTHQQQIQRLGVYMMMAGATWRDSFKDDSGLALAGACAHVQPDAGRLILEDGFTEGCAVTQPITPTGQSFAGWERLQYAGEIPNGARLTVDVLAADGTLLLADLPNGAGLASLDPAAHPSVRLRANLSRGSAAASPVLEQWAISWRPAGSAVLTPRAYLPLLLRAPSLQRAAQEPARNGPADAGPDGALAETWAPTALTANDINALAVDPSDPRVIYATVGSSFGWGVYKTTDGGGSWPAVYSGFPNYAVAVDPLHPAVVYAGETHHAVKSVNGGATWVDLPDLGAASVTALAVDPVNTATVYAGVEYGWGVYKTTNGGARWQQALTSTYPNVLAVDPFAPTTIYVGARDYYDNPGGMLKSLDSGATWTRMMTSTQVNAIACDPEHEGTLYVGTEEDGALRSTDGGRSWQPINHGLTHRIVRALIVDPIHPQVLFAGTWEGGVFKSTNGGETWVSFNNGLANTYVYSLALDPVKARTLYAGTHGNGVFKATVLPPPPPVGSTYVTVTDAQGQPVEGARVYRNGSLVQGASGQPLETDWVGNLVLPTVEIGDRLVASLSLHRQPTSRPAHDNWAYEVLTTSLRIGDDSSVRGDEVAAFGQQRLKLRSPLVLFNLLISLEWNAEDDYLEQIRSAVQQASDYLFDISDGQMAFGRVAIYDDAEHWSDADIQVLARNDVRPYGYFGGLLSGDPGLVIRVGRGWDRQRNVQARWDAPDGYRTLVHELGHYALGLYDSYFGYRWDSAVNRWTLDDSVGCTAHRSKLANQPEAVAATMMNWQYTTTELSDRGLPGILWADLCKQTAQWQLSEREQGVGESDWDTLLRLYADTHRPPRWTLTRPAARGHVLAGPTGLPRDLLALPASELHRNPAPAPLRLLTVLDTDGAPYTDDAKVTLEVVRGDVRTALDQGWIDGQGRIIVVGAPVSATLTAMSADGSRQGQVIVGAEVTCHLTLDYIRPPQLAAVTSVNPYVSIWPASGGRELILRVGGVAPGGYLSAMLTPPGHSTAGQMIPRLSYSAATGEYGGVVQLVTSATGLGAVQVVGQVGPGQQFTVDSSFHLAQAEAATDQDFYSPDGLAWLHTMADTFTNSSTYVALMPVGALPKPLPAGMTAMGDAYSIRASDTNLLAPAAILQMAYDPAQLAPGIAPAALRVARWDAEAARWQPLSTVPSPERFVVSASAAQFGIYALLRPNAPTQCSYLPLLLAP